MADNFETLQAGAPSHGAAEEAETATGTKWEKGSKHEMETLLYIMHKEIDMLRGSLASKNAELDSLERQHQAKVSGLHEQISQLLEERSQLNVALTEKSTLIQQLQQAALRDAISKADLQAKTHTEKSALNKQVKFLMQELENMRSEVGSLQQSASELVHLQDLAVQLENERDEERARRQAVEEERDRAQSENVLADTEVGEMIAELEQRLEEEKAARAEECRKLQATIQKLTGQSDTSEEALLVNLVKKNRQLEADLEELQNHTQIGLAQQEREAIERAHRCALAEERELVGRQYLAHIKKLESRIASLEKEVSESNEGHNVRITEAVAKAEQSAFQRGFQTARAELFGAKNRNRTETPPSSSTSSEESDNDESSASPRTMKNMQRAFDLGFDSAREECLRNLTQHRLALANIIAVTDTTATQQTQTSAFTPPQPQPAPTLSSSIGRHPSPAPAARAPTATQSSFQPQASSFVHSRGNSAVRLPTAGTDSPRAQIDTTSRQTADRSGSRAKEADVVPCRTFFVAATPQFTARAPATARSPLAAEKRLETSRQSPYRRSCHTPPRRTTTEPRCMMDSPVDLLRNSP